MKKLVCLFFLVLIISCQSKQPNLEKIIFHTDDYGCWGLCPKYHLEIKNDLTARLYVEKFLYYDSICYKTNFEKCETKTDSSKIGYFQGKIDSQKYNQIKRFIEENWFDTIQNNSHKTNCNDGLYQKYILYFSQNKRKEILYNCSGNLQLDSLNSLLFNLIDNHNLKKIKGSFYLENLKLKN